MAKKPLVHCRICKREIDRETQTDWIMPKEKWYYHTSCYNDFANKRGRIQEADLTIEVEDDLWKDAVWQYMRKDLKASLNWQKFSSQWNNFLKKGMTAKGIYFALRWHYDITKGDPSKCEQGIGIIPHIYQEGTTYWGERNQRNQGICARIEAQIRQLEDRKVKIVQQKKKKNAYAAIDLASIADMEDGE